MRERERKTEYIPTGNWEREKKEPVNAANKISFNHLHSLNADPSCSPPPPQVFTRGYFASSVFFLLLSTQLVYFSATFFRPAREKRLQVQSHLPAEHIFLFFLSLVGSRPLFLSLSPLLPFAVLEEKHNLSKRITAMKEKNIAIDNELPHLRGKGNRLTEKRTR